MIAQYVNVNCPRSCIVKKFYYYEVHPPGKRLPYPTGCETSYSSSRMCQHCTDIVVRTIINAWKEEKFIPNPIETSLENFSDLLRD